VGCGRMSCPRVELLPKMNTWGNTKVKRELLTKQDRYDQHYLIRIEFDCFAKNTINIKQ